MPDTEFAKLSFSLPEDSGSDELLVYTSDTETGAYTLALTLDYQYGQTSIELADIDVAKWYKIKFRNSVDSKLSPLSVAVDGSNWTDRAAPELYVSTTTDGAYYASIADVRSYTLDSLTVAIASDARVAAALKRARATIDLRTLDMDLDRFAQTFETEVARRKYNAALQTVKEAEINISLGMIFLGMSDDKIINNIEDTTAGTEGEWNSVSIGNSSISKGAWPPGGTKMSDEEMTKGMSALSNRYFKEGERLLTTLHPATIPLRSSHGYKPRTPLERLRYYG